MSIDESSYLNVPLSEVSRENSADSHPRPVCTATALTVTSIPSLQLSPPTVEEPAPLQAGPTSQTENHIGSDGMPSLNKLVSMVQELAFTAARL